MTGFENDGEDEVQIKDTTTGEVRVTKHTVWSTNKGERYGGADEFMWLDGNYGCDCNRGLFFWRAGDVELKDPRCGHGRYVVVSPNKIADNPTCDECSKVTGRGTTIRRAEPCGSDGCSRMLCEYCAGSHWHEEAAWK